MQYVLQRRELGTRQCASDVRRQRLRTRWLSLNSATRACLLPAATLRFRYLQENRIADRYERPAASDWGSLLVRRARAFARGAAHPSGTGGAALAKPARAGDGLLHGNSQYAHQRRDQPAAAARRRAGGALCDEAASLAIPAPADLRAKNHELLWPSAAELRVCGPFAALGYPEHGPICFSGSRLRMPRAREG